jgi:hypothetical protein
MRGAQYLIAMLAWNFLRLTIKVRDTNVLESIVIFMRQYGHEMQKNFGRSEARSWGASGDAAASRQGDS